MIIVGFDGSQESRLAVEIAAERAGPEGTVVAVYATAAPSSWLGRPYYQHALNRIQRDGANVLAETEDLVTGAARVELELIEGEPADVLLRVADARNAREIVVGSRGLGRFRALFGSVSHALLEQASRPVVIVPKEATAP